MVKFIRFFSFLCIIFCIFISSSNILIAQENKETPTNQTSSSVGSNSQLSDKQSVIDIFKIIIIILIILIISLLMGFVFKYFYSLTESNKKGFRIKRR